MPTPPRTPRVASADTCWSEGTAARLAELLAASDGELLASATRAIEGDPCLALFAAREMRRIRLDPPRTLAAAAEWLAAAVRGQAPRWINWQASVPRDDLARSAAANLVARSIATAHIAQQLAGRAETDQQRAFWAGLLWPLVDDSREMALLLGDDEDEALLLAHDAWRELAGGDTEFAACRAAGELARRDWLRPWPGAWELAAAVAGQAERLANLEQRFAHELEQAKLASLAQFAYGAGHEINNPLANISLRAELLARSEPDEARRQKLVTIHAQAMRAHEMLADLMLFAKPPTAEPQPCDLMELVTDVADELSARAAAQETELSLIADAAAISLIADSGQLAVALQALLVNALEAVERGGQIEIACREHVTHPTDGRSGCELAIRDSGPGIAPEIRTHIFDPFFSGREAGRGLGFGLCKAWRIVQLHAGELTVESRVGEGATFRIWLPAERERQATEEAGTADLRAPHFDRPVALRATD